MQDRVRGIIERTLTELTDIGMDSEGAAALLAIQGTIRLETREKRREVAQFVASTLYDPADR
jgi:hypothetical protein